MERMSVTRDVSKLSGWLNTFARCVLELREKKPQLGLLARPEVMG